MQRSTKPEAPQPVKPTWFEMLKRNKLVAILVSAGVIVFAVVTFFGNVAGIGDFAGKVIAYFSEPLKVSVDAGVLIEPWHHLITPYPPAPGQKPIPMWVSFRTTVTSNTNLWISGYSMSAKTKHGWVKLEQPRIPLGERYTPVF